MAKTISNEMENVARGIDIEPTSDEYDELCIEMDKATREAINELATKYGLDNESETLDKIVNKIGCLISEVAMNKDEQVALETMSVSEAMALSLIKMSPDIQNHIVAVAISGFLYGIHFANIEMK